MFECVCGVCFYGVCSYFLNCVFVYVLCV